MEKEVVLKEPLPFEFTVKNKAVCVVMFLIGVAGFVYGLLTEPERAWMSYLMSFFLVTSVSLSSLFFLALQHLSGAQWSVNIRRLFEALAAFLPYSILFMGLMIIGAPEVYSWLNPETVAHDALLQHKAPYLNYTFFIIRSVVFFLGWWFFYNRLTAGSLKHDETGDDSLIEKLVPYSVLFIIFFTLSYSFLSVDLIMSLEPHWFSTIFGVYTFGGSMQTMFAAVILLMLYICKKELFNGMVTLDHLHDLGKFLLGFTIFWAYIAFSQYMLIWYANIPEETIFFYHRSEGAWAILSLCLLVFKFIIPFLLLLPRWAKRTPKYIGAVSVGVILTQVLDLYWLIYPNLDGHHIHFSIIEVSVMIGFTGAFVFSVFSFLSKHSLIPVKDPRIKNSASHEVVY